MWGGQCGGRGRGAEGDGVTDQLPQVRAHLCHFPHQARLTHASIVAAVTGDEGKQNLLKSESVRERERVLWAHTASWAIAMEKSAQ